MRISDWSSDVCSSDLGFEELAGLALGIEPAVLVGLGAGEGGDALHEVVDALGRTAFLAEHGCDDLGGLGLGKAPLAQEILAIFVLPGDDALARRLDAVHAAHRRGIRDILARRCGLVRAAVELGRASCRARVCPYV